MNTRAGYAIDIMVLPGNRYMLRSPLVYQSTRYSRTCTVPEGFVMDGATGAVDILTRGWIVHDWLTDSGVAGPRNIGCLWDDGFECTRWESSTVLADCLKEDGFWVRAPFWRLATYLAGWF